VGTRCIDHATLYPQKLALPSPTSGSLSVGIIRSRTQATEFVSEQLLNNFWSTYHWQCGRGSRYCIRGSCPYFSRYYEVFRQALRRPMDRTKWPVVWPRDHPISLLQTSTCGDICKASFAPNSERALESHSGWDKTATSFGAPWITATKGLRHALTIMKGYSIIFHKPFVTGQMQFCSQQINSFPQLRHFTSFLYSCFQVSYLLNEAIVTILFASI
jgi:hypothetical protein